MKRVPVLFLWFCLIAVCPANATIRYVPMPFPTIQSAISASSPYDTVMLLPNEYYERVIVTFPLVITSTYIENYDSTVIVNTRITIPDSIRGGGDSVKSVFRGHNIDYCKLIGLTIHSGLGTTLTTGGVTRIWGGAVFFDSSRVDLERCHIKGSFAHNGGGAAFSICIVNINSCLIDSCTGSEAGRSGGGLYAVGDSITINDSQITSNRHTDFVGGGLAIVAFRSGSIENSVIGNNIAKTIAGGGAVSGCNFYNCKIINNQSSGIAGLYLNPPNQNQFAGNFNGNIVANNLATNTLGANATEVAGIIFDGYTSTHWNIKDNTFLNNVAFYTHPFDVGAMLIEAASAEVSGNRFIGNQALHGAAILARLGARVTADSNYFEGNIGTDIVKSRNGGTLTLTNSDFIWNRGLAVSREPSNVVSAINNFWGDSTGPRAVDNPNGRGDTLPSNITYRPFLATPVFPQNEIGEGGNSKPGNPFAIKQYALLHTYPNPANGTVTITYSLPHPELQTRLEIFDQLGRRVSLLYDGALTSGEHRFQWNPAGVSSSTYYLRASQTTTPSKTTAIRYVK